MGHIRLGIQHHYESEEEFRVYCESYFNSISPGVWTIGGLAHYLGMTSAEMKEAASADSGMMGRVLSQAMTVMESEYEKRLKASGKDSVFALKAMGWRDKDTEGPVKSNGSVMPAVVVTDGVSTRELTYKVGEAVE